MHKKPNVIFIYADDLGYGDLSCYGAEDLKTPNIDSLLDHGIKFTNGYSTSAVCTPARYSVITGEYPFRNWEQTRILKGDAKLIIDTQKNTLPKIFKKAGYTTGIVGKWHLGLGDGTIDWNGKIKNTPNDVGFDYSFIFPGTADRVPCVYVKNRTVCNLDKNDPINVCYSKENPFDNIETYENSPEKILCKSSHGHMDSLIHGIGRMGFMQGGKSALWKDEELAEGFLDEAKQFVEKNVETPFFLLYTVHQPHVPRIPNKKFLGKSKLGARGDVILELDYCVGELVNHLKKLNMLEDTMIILSSDNGPVLDDGYMDEAVEKNGFHKPSGPLRGGKYTKFEGGARVPFIVSWKDNLTKKVSDEIICQVDLAASFANMLNVNLNEKDCVDSVNLIDLMLGKNEVGRKEVLFENNLKTMTLRQGKWSYLTPSDHAVFSPEKKLEMGISLDEQLYNLNYDIGQQINVAIEYPEIVKNMKDRINEIVNR